MFWTQFLIVDFPLFHLASFLRILPFLWIGGCFFVLEFCHFNYDVSWNGPLWVPLAWDSLWFLDLCDFFSHQIREIFHHYFFKQVFCLLLFFSFWYPYYTDIIVSCCPAFPLTPLHSFWASFPFLAHSGSFFFYLVLQFSDPILCFIKPAFDSF